MAYDRQISTDWGSIVGEVADKLAGMTNWSLYNDQRTVGHIAIQTPHTIGTNNQLLILESTFQGDGSEATSDGITVAYSTDDPNWYDAGDNATWDSYWSTAEWFNGNYAGTDTLEYWLEYVTDRGFVLAIRRTMADGNDGFFWVGWEDYTGPGGTEHWDPRQTNEWPYTRDSRVSYYIGASGHGGTGSYSRDGNLGSEGGRRAALVGVGNLTSDFAIVSTNRGLLNPDGNFSDYVWVSRNLLRADFLSNTETGEHPYFADFADPLMMSDYSASDLNSGDVIQDDGATDQWEVLEYHAERVVVRML